MLNQLDTKMEKNLKDIGKKILTYTIALGIGTGLFVGASAGTYKMFDLLSKYSDKRKAVSSQTLENRVEKVGPTFEKYGKNIDYYDFSKIPKEVNTTTKIDLPKDLEKHLSNILWQGMHPVGNEAWFKSQFLEEARKLGYSEEKLKSMNFKDAIMAAVKTVASRFTYHEVDKDPKFLDYRGEQSEIDIYFMYGKGDCDKYRDATIYAFRVIKEINTNLKNVYLSTQDLGGTLTNHAWVSVLIVQEDHIILSHIDPTYYDNGGKLEAGKFHIQLKDDAFKSVFYTEIGDKNAAEICSKNNNQGDH